MFGLLAGFLHWTKASKYKMYSSWLVRVENLGQDLHRSPDVSEWNETMLFIILCPVCAAECEGESLTRSLSEFDVIWTE